MRTLFLPTVLVLVAGIAIIPALAQTDEMVINATTDKNAFTQTPVTLKPLDGPVTVYYEVNPAMPKAGDNSTLSFMLVRNGTMMPWTSTDDIVVSAINQDNQTVAVWDNLHSMSGVIQLPFKFTKTGFWSVQIEIISSKSITVNGLTGVQTNHCVAAWMQDVSQWHTVSRDMANETVPEFSSLAPIVLAIAVIGIIIFSAHTRIIPKF